MTITAATPSDVPQLVSLVNSGYRGEGSKKGWTTEADLLEGELRVDIPTLQTMMEAPGATVLKAVAGDAIVGCVYLQQQEKGLYLGLLTVTPDLQAGGIGKKLLVAAEDHAKKREIPAIFMTVITQRKELIAWYERKGYQATGETKPFPTDNRFGTPTEHLEFIVLEKQV